MAALDLTPCLVPLCPACTSGLMVEAVDDEPGPEDRVLCRGCGDIGTRQQVVNLIERKGKTTERRMAEALTRVLREHGPQQKW